MEPPSEFSQATVKRGCPVAAPEGTNDSAWVRDALRRAREETVYPEAIRKLRAVREASAFTCPVADIDPMLAEIERGYHDETIS